VDNIGINDDIYIALPKDVEFVIHTLNKNSYQAFIVGGCVRDALLGIEPKDWDITTDALPYEIKNIFEKTIDTGLKHGTVTVLTHNQSIEVTTYRIEGKYSDHRRPDKVIFTSHLEQDLARRDFTINSIAYHPQKGIIDPFKGIYDLNKGIIRAVGDADKRFEEVALRMLRALRFSAQLGFKIDADTMESIKKKKTLINSISKERIRNELENILLSKNSYKFLLLKETGLLAFVLPELDKYSINKIKYIIKGIERIESDSILRWTMLLHKEDVESARSILKKLKFDNYTIKRVCMLVKYHSINIVSLPQCVKKVVSIIGDEMFLKLMKIKEAIFSVEVNHYLNKSKKLKNSELEKYYELEKKKIDKIIFIYHSAKEKGECMNIKELAVNGNDLVNIGFKEGKRIGEILKILLEIVIQQPDMNSKEDLLRLAASHL
jgi:tRNA nucleotidyltransferase (CCA-adding enzyme)